VNAAITNKAGGMSNAINRRRVSHFSRPEYSNATATQATVDNSAGM
jgi:hypothetical protein